MIAKQTPIHYTSSSFDVWDAFLQTDMKMNDNNTELIMWDMFTDSPNAQELYEFDFDEDRDQGSCPGGEGECYNREHTFPISWWGGGKTASDTQFVDLHHIVPSDRSINNIKSNNPPGMVKVPSSISSNGFKSGTNSAYPDGTYFKPIDEYKGDYARMYLYFATRYEHNMKLWYNISSEGNRAMSGDAYTCYEPWLLKVFFNWHRQDPVSKKEIDRNNAVFAIQGNRNPFIDHPGWVALIWNK